MMEYLPLIAAVGVALLVFVISVAPIWRLPPREGDQLKLAPQPTSLLQHFEKHNHCPDCGGRLLEGPQGGLCINCRCEDCGNKFNIGSAGGEVWFVDRIGGKRQNAAN